MRVRGLGLLSGVQGGLVERRLGLEWFVGIHQVGMGLGRGACSCGRGGIWMKNIT